MTAHAPLEPGDNIALAVDIDMPAALAGEPGDVVLLVVPPGRGLAVEAWLRRQILSTPEDRQDRREQDALALVTAGALKKEQNGE